LTPCPTVTVQEIVVDGDVANVQWFETSGIRVSHPIGCDCRQNPR